MIILALLFSLLLSVANVTFADTIFLEEDFSTDPTSQGWNFGDTWAFGFRWYSGDGWVHNRFNNVDVEEAYLISPSFSTVGAFEGTVSFNYRKEFTTLNTDLNLEYRLGGSGSWTTIWSSSDGQVVDWEIKNISIPAGMLDKTDVQLRWYTVGEGVPGEPPFGIPERIIGDFWLDDVVIASFEEPTPEPTNTPTSAPTSTPAPDCIHNGDINQDSVITSADAQLAFLITLGQYAPTHDEECAADCNGDDRVTSADAQLIFQTGLGTANCVDPL